MEITQRKCIPRGLARRTSPELYCLLKPFLATTTCYNRAARSATTHGSFFKPRVIEFVPEEKRPVRCWLPVIWVPPNRKLWREWTRLTYAQFCEAYQLPIEC